MRSLAVLVAIVSLWSCFASSEVKPGSTEFKGTYVWDSRPSRIEPLRAVFTPDGDEEWQVVFYFNFDGRDYRYRGRATGSLINGSLAGKVYNENRRRTFTFSGTTHDGVFEGHHSETTPRRQRETGTMALTSKQ